MGNSARKLAGDIGEKAGHALDRVAEKAGLGGLKPATAGGLDLKVPSPATQPAATKGPATFLREGPNTPATPDAKSKSQIFVKGAGDSRAVQTKADILNRNRKMGADFEQKVFDKEAIGSSNIQREITVKTGSGTRTRLDIVGRKSGGEVKCIECKSSTTAPLTKNQQKAFPEIEKFGATVVGKGNPGFEQGTKIPPTKVEIIRPDLE